MSSPATHHPDVVAAWDTYAEAVGAFVDADHAEAQAIYAPPAVLRARQAATTAAAEAVRVARDALTRTADAHGAPRSMP